MKPAWMLVTLIAIVPAAVAAEERHPSRLLADALARGKADPESIAAIVRWVLEEKEENVAAGFARALQEVVRDGDRLSADPRWDAVARGAVGLFADLLDDARYRPRDPASLERDLAPLVEAAAPAVAEALREADAPTREAVRRAWELFAPALPCAPPR